jgi:hypothetical protein
MITKNTHQLVKKVKAGVIFDKNVLIGANKTQDVVMWFFIFQKYL